MWGQEVVSASCVGSFAFRWGFGDRLDLGLGTWMKLRMELRALIGMLDPAFRFSLTYDTTPVFALTVGSLGTGAFCERDFGVGFFPFVAAASALDIAVFWFIRH